MCANKSLNSLDDLAETSAAPTHWRWQDFSLWCWKHWKHVSPDNVESSQWTVFGNVLCDFGWSDPLNWTSFHFITSLSEARSYSIYNIWYVFNIQVNSFNMKPSREQTWSLRAAAHRTCSLSWSVERSSSSNMFVYKCATNKSLNMQHKLQFRAYNNTSVYSQHEHWRVESCIMLMNQMTKTLRIWTHLKTLP